MVRNPSTGEQFKKPADKVVKMTIAKALKDSVNDLIRTIVVQSFGVAVFAAPFHLELGVK